MSIDAAFPDQPQNTRDSVIIQALRSPPPPITNHNFFDIPKIMEAIEVLTRESESRERQLSVIDIDVHQPEYDSPTRTKMSPTAKSCPPPSTKSTRNIIPLVDDSANNAVLRTSTTDDGTLMIATTTTGEGNPIDMVDRFTMDSDLGRRDRMIWVVTTAALPWRTGTAVNPLLRALYLTRGRAKGMVTLLIPWISDPQAQETLYGTNGPFQSEEEQESWIRNFCRTRAGCADEEPNLVIRFWKGVYHHNLGSILPAVDVCSLIPAQLADVAILEEPEHLNWFRVPATTVSKRRTGGDTDQVEESETTTIQLDKEERDRKEMLGWAFKFRHVVGIMHTNYASYIQQYGMGTSLITAPALNALSKLVVKAYCHKVIRLSDTLTPFVPRKEVTCNVHGVRDEFFLTDTDHSKSFDYHKTPQDNKCAAVYFIGKLIWAKGFEHILRLQERYRSKHGEYFALDVYGDGNDAKAIKRAFFGRAARRQDTDESAGSSTEEDEKLAAEIFDRDESLRVMLHDRQCQPSPDNADTANQFRDNSNAEDEDTILAVISADEVADKVNCAVPLDVVSDLTKRTIGTGMETAGAALQLVETALTHGFGAFAPREPILAPALATYKWRRHPLPARFLGGKDHIELKYLPQTIFLNMSTTEVLCTTTAEALAMGKFVILPKHPSNDFFYQFPNCLAYETLDECVDHLIYAFRNKPTPLTDEIRHQLSWEGAIERLYEAAGITEERAREIIADKEVEQDKKAAQFHVETARKSQFVGSLFSGKRSKGQIVDQQ